MGLIVENVLGMLKRRHPQARATADAEELLRTLQRARVLTDALADVSMGYGYDCGNNLYGGGLNIDAAVYRYEVQPRDLSEE